MSTPRWSPLWHRILRSAAGDARGQVRDVPFVTASALRDRGLGTLWWRGEEACLTINDVGRAALAEWDAAHPDPTV